MITKVSSQKGGMLKLMENNVCNTEHLIKVDVSGYVLVQNKQHYIEDKTVAYVPKKHALSPIYISFTFFFLYIILHTYLYM